METDQLPRRSLATPLRCLAVWLTATCTLSSVGLLCAAELHAQLLPAASGPSALLLLAALAGTVACVVLWHTITTVCWAAARGLPARRDGLIRRLTLLACGLGIAASVTTPALASDISGLDGLPHPERPSAGEVFVSSDAAPFAPAEERLVKQPTPVAFEARESEHHVVTGDNLWTIARTHLSDAQTPHSAIVQISPAELANHVRALHHANRDVVGEDPDLIHPGQRLDLSPLTPSAHAPVSPDQITEDSP